MHNWVELIVSFVVYLPLIMLAFGNLHVRTKDLGITVNIGKMGCSDETRFAYQFPSLKPIIDIEI